MFSYRTKTIALMVSALAITFTSSAHALPRGAEFKEQIREASGEQAHVSDAPKKSWNPLKSYYTMMYGEKKNADTDKAEGLSDLAPAANAKQ